MSSGVRALTLVVAAAVFVFGGVTGLRLLAASPEGAATDAGATCTASTIAAGQELTSNLVTVNVFNASNRSGLANRVLINLQANGFLGGQIGNNESAAKPRRVAILTKDPKDPRVKLVAAQFKDKVTYETPDVTVEDGVVVIIGDDYSGLRDKADTKTKVDSAVQVCRPVAPLQ